MKTHGWLRNLAVVAVSAFTLASASAHVAPQSESRESTEARLIQIEPGRKIWLNPDQVRALMEKSHAEGHCGGFMDVTEHADKPVRRQLGLYDVAGYPEPRHVDSVEIALSQLSSDRLRDDIDKLSNQFKNRFYKSQSGVAAAEWIRDRYLAAAAGRKDVTAELFLHKRFIQPSVIVRIQGQGPHAHERVILGAHEDSVNWKTNFPSANDLAPGADDDASGVATLLEAFRVLMATGFQPDRTVEFMAYAGEELGLLGSQDIAENYAKNKISVVGVQQFDMTLFPSAAPEIGIIADHTNKALNLYTEKLLDTYVKAKWSESKCGYACSDHASWTDAGYPSAFPFEDSEGDGNPNIHTTKDVLEILDPSFGLHFSKLAVAFAIELGNP